MLTLCGQTRSLGQSCGDVAFEHEMASAGVSFAGYAERVLLRQLDCGGDAPLNA